LAGIAPIGRFIVENKTEEADAPPSEMPREFGADTIAEDDVFNHPNQTGSYLRRKEGTFQL